MDRRSTTISSIAAVERVTVSSLLLDQRARAAAYADPAPRLHLTERDLCDAAGRVLLREARLLGVQATVGV